MSKFSLIVAINTQSLIGIKHYDEYAMPWPNIKIDMEYFRQLTTNGNNLIIMGMNTFKSLPELYFKNKQRTNIVLSRNDHQPKYGEYYCKNLDEAINFNEGKWDNIYLIGGGQIYKEAMLNPRLDKLYITKINYEFVSNDRVQELIYFPYESYFDVLSSTEKTDDLTQIKCTFNVCKLIGNLVPINKNPIPIDNSTDYEENQYLDLVKKIMDEGEYKTGRNGEYKSIFDYRMRFDLEKGYPLWTVKQSYPKNIFEELMWMIRGQTNNELLVKKGCNVWKDNSSRDFLDKAGLHHLQEGDIGVGYGFQMRYFGAKYIDCNTNYKGQGFDQLEECIKSLKNNPNDRRIIISMWNPMDLKNCALPPCHVMYQFNVTNDGKLNCMLTQRSFDVLLGWNTATAALFTYIMANHCGLKPGILTHSIGDAHLYKEHIDKGAIDKLLQRRPNKPPKLNIKIRRDNIEDYEWTDFELIDYMPCPPIRAKMIA